MVRFGARSGRVPGACLALARPPARRLEAGAALPPKRPNVRASDSCAEGLRFEPAWTLGSREWSREFREL
jgi:hypothetical protein